MSTERATSVGNDPLQVSPWHHMVLWIFDNFLDEDIEKILLYYQPEQNDDDQEMLDEHSETTLLQKSFTNAIDKDEDTLKSAQYLQKVMQQLRLHTSFGDSVADKLQEYIDELQVYQNHHVVERNQVFVGRDRDVALIKDLCMTHRTAVGVCICGIGGQGKSTLARQVCYALQSEPRPWNVCIADLRGRECTTDVIKSILREAGITCSQDELSDLQNTLTDFLSSCTDDIVICLDDCDFVIQHDKRAFFNTVQLVLRLADEKRDKCKIRFLFTMRQKVEVARGKKDHTADDRFEIKLGGALAELELEALQGYDAVELLRKSSGEIEIDDRVAKEIVEECACSPLAITVVSELLRKGAYTPQHLWVHLNMDKKNVSKALRVDKCIGEAVKHLDPNLQKILVRLSVFQASPFDPSSAYKVMGMNASDGKVNLEQLHAAHLVEVESKSSSGSKEKNGSKVLYSLHSLVYRYVGEWKKPKEFETEFKMAVVEFMKLYESTINTIVRLMNSKGPKGIKRLNEHRVHVLQYYDYLLDKVSLLEEYPKKAKLTDVLKKKRVSDLTDLLLADVKKRRLFQSEGKRAKKVGNDSMLAFWTVEEADVLVMLHDKAGMALKLLDGLSEGRFAALRRFHEDSFYPPLVHALFHKVKGLCRWKMRQYEDALNHLNLTAKFYQQCSSSNADAYKGLTARLHRYLAEVYLDVGDLDHAEEAVQKGYQQTIAMICTKDGSKEADKELQWDIPTFLGFLGTIKLRRARAETDTEQRNRYLSAALDVLNRGMKLDTQLSLHRLNGYCMKLKCVADVYIEQELLDNAIEAGYDQYGDNLVMIWTGDSGQGKMELCLIDVNGTHEPVAEKALDLRREILQPPHIQYTESVYQMALAYMLKGRQLQKAGEPGEADKYWITSKCYFDELEEHHLINGSITTDHPMYQDIKRDHLQVVQLMEDHSKHQKLTVFYKNLEKGRYDSKAKSFLTSFKEMMHTPMEYVKNMYGSGGTEFGEKEVFLQQIEEQGDAQIERMMAGEPSGGRLDSGHGDSCTEDSVSSDDGSSVSSQLRRLQMEKSVSLEDDVFQSSYEKSTEEKRERHQTKRQKTEEYDDQN